MTFSLITFGSVYSNHNRVAAAVASYLGMECDLIVLSDDRKADYEKLGGNGKLIQSLKANIIPCKTDEAHSFIDEYLAKAESEGTPYLWIPGGGHMKEVVFAYADAAQEINKQYKEYGVNFKSVFLPCGTGTTQAGLLYGFRGSSQKVIGITVARPEERCCKEIMNLLEEVDENFDGGGINV